MAWGGPLPYGRGSELAACNEVSWKGEGTGRHKASILHFLIVAYGAVRRGRRHTFSRAAGSPRMT